MFEKLSMWIGRWYIVFWSSKRLILEIGIGKNYAEGNYGPFFAHPKTFGPFYFVVSKPTLRYIQETEYPENQLKGYNK